MPAGGGASGRCCEKSMLGEEIESKRSRQKDKAGILEDTEEVHEKDNFRIAAAVKFVPKFDEADVEQYLFALEKNILINIIEINERRYWQHTE